MLLLMWGLGGGLLLFSPPPPPLPPPLPPTAPEPVDWLYESGLSGPVVAPSPRVGIDNKVGVAWG